MSALEFLDLGWNSIQSLVNFTDSTKSILPNLKNLKLTGNQISLVQKDLLCNKSVETLNLHNNGIGVIPPFSCCETLRVLHVGMNMLTSFNGTYFCPELTYLELQNNLLEMFPDLSRNSKLNFIYLHGNQIASVDASSIPALLTGLKLKNNNFTTFPDLADKKSQIETLDLSENHLGDPPENILRGYTSLKHLYLNNIGMTKLFRLSHAGDTLETVEIKYNSIHILDESMMPGMVALKVWDLRNNLLTSVPFDLLSTYTVLEKMDVRGNQISDLGHSEDDTSTYEVCFFVIYCNCI